MKNPAMPVILLILTLCLQPVECNCGNKDVVCHATETFGLAIDTSKLKPHQSTDTSVYSAIYAFGDLKSESYLLVVAWDNKLIVQHQRKRFNENRKKWIREYQTMDPMALDGHRITSPGWSAEFVSYTIYSDAEVVHSNLVSTPYPVDRLQGLLIHDSPLGIQNEFGVKVENGLENCPGSSIRLLDESDIQGRSKKDLQIMRNEIFAWYGYKFKPGGEMDRHFRTKPWYAPLYNEVFQWLTEIEKANVVFIRDHE